MESRQGTTAERLAMTLKLHGQHLLAQTKQFFLYNTGKNSTLFFSLLLILDMKKQLCLCLVHLSVLALTKYFPIKGHHLHTPWHFEQKPHATFNFVLAGQTNQTCSEHNRFTLSPSVSQSPALFTFCWQGDLEVFGPALRSLGTIRRFTF